MKKSHGPALKRERIELKKCATCRGTCFIKPMIYELDCPDCNASGWVAPDTGEALPLEQLVTHLSLRLQKAESQLAQFSKVAPSGAAKQYEQNNRRGAGGSNFTGD